MKYSSLLADIWCYTLFACIKCLPGTHFCKLKLLRNTKNFKPLQSKLHIKIKETAKHLGSKRSREMSLERDYFHNVHQYIYQMLMEDDHDVPMFPESDIQAAEKSLYEVLDQKVPSFNLPRDDNIGTCHNQCINSTSPVALEGVVESNQMHNQGEPKSPLDPPSPQLSASSSNNVNPLVQMLMEDNQDMPIFHECDIQATEKSLYEALDQKVTSYDSPHDNNIGTNHNQCINSTTIALENVVESNHIHNPGELQSSLTKSYHLDDFVPPSSPSSAASSNNVNPFIESVNYSLNGTKGNKHYFEEFTNTNDCLQET